MIVSSPSSIYKDLYLFFLIGGLFLLIPFLWECKPISPLELNSPMLFSQNQKGSLHYPSFGHVFFSEEASSKVVAIHKEISLTTYVGRPDHSLQSDYCLSLNSSRETKKAKFGEKIYLKLNENQDLSFSQEPSSLWVVAREDLTQVCLDMQEKELFHKNWLVFPKSYSAIPSTDPIVRKVSQLHFLGRDLLAKQQNKAILVLEFEGKTLFFKEDSYWVVEGATLREKKPHEDTSSFYLVKAFCKEDKKLQMQVWDLEGNSTIVSILPSPSSPIKITLSEITASLGPRTFTKISFFCGKTLLLLQELEAVQKTKKGWQRFSFEEEGDAFLFHRTKYLEGKTLVQGEIFNSTRTLSQKVELPLLPKDMIDKTSRKGVLPK